MHANFLALSALDLARERSLEADRRARLLQGAGRLPRSLPRRLLGRLAASVSRAASRLAVQLDDEARLGGTAA
jgi:hypothetical protein